jgi:hypothetical protein
MQWHHGQTLPPMKHPVMLTEGKHLAEDQSRIHGSSRRCFTPFNMTRHFIGFAALATA